MAGGDTGPGRHQEASRQRSWPLIKYSRCADQDAENDNDDLMGGRIAPEKWHWATTATGQTHRDMSARKQHRANGRGHIPPPKKTK